MPDFHFNKTFKEVFTTDKRYIDVWGGRGRGGSYFASDYFLFLITQPQYFRGYFVRQTFNDIRNSLFQDIKDRIAKNETLDIEDFKINEVSCSLVYLPTGNKIISKGVSGDGKRTAKMKSLAGATHVAIEEADEMGEPDFDQLDASLRTTETENIQIIRVFNPPSKNHWIWKRYNFIPCEIEGCFKAEPKSDSDVLSIWSTYHDNIKNVSPNSIVTFEAFKNKDIEYYNNQILGLINEGAKGRIYSGWLPITDEYFHSLDLPYIYVIDFGYSNDPNAVIQEKWDNQHRYVKELLYENGLDNLELAKRLHDLGIKPTDIIIADMGGGGDLRIAELRRGWKNIEGYPDLCFSVYPTIKGEGSINFGISRVKSTVMHLTESSLNGWKEYQEYKWRLDRDKNPLDIPIDAHNHIMDCIRYFELNKGTMY